VQASYARTGYRSEGRPTRAELEQAVARMTQLVEQMTNRPAPAAKAAATKEEAKERLHQAALEAAKRKTVALAADKAQKRKLATNPTPAAKAAATKPKKKITKPTAPTLVMRRASDFDDLVG
jgi:hypothetical protein